MNPLIGWTLAVLMLGLGWQQYGWQGAVFAVTVVVFWLLLQFNKAVRVMRQAGSAPVGYIDSAVMLNAKLKPNMTLIQVVALTKSLGQKVGEEPEQFRWTDASGSHVTLELRRGRALRWFLWRPPVENGVPATPAPSASAAPGLPPSS